METKTEKKTHPISVRIQNFQSIADVSFVVDGFTCIVGKTNIGKSATIRAISGALLNSPVTGDVRKSAKFCSVSLQSKDWGFRWEKGASGGGVYYINGIDKPLDKIGQGQIDVISKMGFNSVEIGDHTTQAWFASQFDTVFLLNETGPSVTDFISGVSRLTILQDAIIYSMRNKKKHLDEVKIREGSINKLKKKEASVAGVDRLIELKKDLVDQAESINRYEEKILSIEKHKDHIEKNSVAVKDLEKIDSVKVPDNLVKSEFDVLKTIVYHQTQCDESADKIRTLRGVMNVKQPELPDKEMDNLKLLNKHLCIPKLATVVEKLEHVTDVKIPGIDVSQLVSDIKKIESHAKQIEKMTRLVEKLSKNVALPESVKDVDSLSKIHSHLGMIKNTESEVFRLEAKLSAASVELKEVQDELSKIPVCVTCNRPLTDNDHSDH
jgi:hypothetical protein